MMIDVVFCGSFLWQFFCGYLILGEGKGGEGRGGEGKG